MKITSNTIEMMAWQTKTASAFRIKKEPSPFDCSKAFPLRGRLVDGMEQDFDSAFFLGTLSGHGLPDSHFE